MDVVVMSLWRLVGRHIDVLTVMIEEGCYSGVSMLMALWGMGVLLMSLC